MGTPVGGGETRPEHSIIQCGRYLADTAANLLYHLTVVVGRCTAVAPGLRSLTHGIIEGKFLARLHHRAVQCLRRQLNVLVPHSVGGGLRGIAADGGILALNRAGRRNRIAYRSDLLRIISGRQGLHDLFRRGIRIDLIAILAPAENKLALFTVIAGQTAVGGRHLPYQRQLRHLILHRFRKVRKLQCIIRLQRGAAAFCTGFLCAFLILFFFLLG